MGRGRQKAKHTKVARELKYFSPDTNLSALEEELVKTQDAKLEENLAKWADVASDESDNNAEKA
ncbi:MAG: DUF3073 domain-containing protein [Aurantimicrobium sp.]|jgi:hypothetical protein|nr:DUF3073 domain-containing protein [Aurantimicrobium sp.]